MQFLITPIKISLKNLMAAKLRSFLTILGIIIGVASVVIIFAAGQSAQELIIGRISDTGSNLIVVLPGKSEEDGPPAAAFGIETKTLTYEDYKYLTNSKNIYGIENGMAITNGTLNVTYKDRERATTVQGVTASYLEMEDTMVDKGRFFTENQENTIEKIAVIGPMLAIDLFGKTEVVGEKLKIKNQKFEIIGVLEERQKGGLGTGGQDNNVLIPLKTSQKITYNIDYLNAIRLKATDATLIPGIKENIRQALRSRHNIDDPIDDDFSVRDLASAIGIITDVTNVIRYFLLSVGSISLLVGGVGIMNIMLIAVNQRIREVGLRKALGAKNKDIRIQFLVESIAVSLTGGILGMVFGIFASFLIFLVANVLGYDWQFLISPFSIFVAITVSIIVGLIFGSYPAQKAAQISPMEALRYE